MTQDKPTVLITGVTGFIGRYVARQLALMGWTTIGIGTRPPENAPQQNLTHYYQLALPSSELAAIIRHNEPQICIHCAGRASVALSVEDPAADFAVNADVTFSILNALRCWAPQCKVINLSSAAVYGNPQSLPIREDHTPRPISPYGFHKLVGEQLCSEFSTVYGLPTASLRVFSAYGPGLRRQVLWDICYKIITQNRLNLSGTGNESRDFIHVLDVVNAIVAIATSELMNGDVYNLGTGQEVTILALAQTILEALDCDSIIPEFDGVAPEGTPLNWQADITKLQSLGFSPSVPLDRGIKTFAYWCRAELVGA